MLLNINIFLSNSIPTLTGHFSQMGIAGWAEVVWNKVLAAW